MRTNSSPFVSGLSGVCCLEYQSVRVGISAHWRPNSRLTLVSSAFTLKHRYTADFYLECKSCSLIPITSSLRSCSNRKEAQVMENYSSSSGPQAISHIAVIWDGKDLLSHPTDPLRACGGFSPLQYADLLFSAFSNCKWQKWWGFHTSRGTGEQSL